MGVDRSPFKSDGLVDLRHSSERKNQVSEDPVVVVVEAMGRMSTDERGKIPC